MKPADLLARVAEAGYRVELNESGPKLVRELGDATLPGQLLDDLKENRDAVLRHLLTAAALARAGEVSRAVWGYASGDGRATQLAGKKVPARWDRICVEGDARWTLLPTIADS